MGLFDLFGKKEVPKTFFALSCEFHPYRLPSGSNDFVDLEISLTNNFDKPVLTSIVVEVPKGLGFERSAIQCQREIRLGTLAAFEKKFVKAQVWNTARTPSGNYGVKITAIAHFNDYAHVLNEARKTMTLRVG
ncbi:hypothetical protein HY993_00900 [Candidatus Micrarchaeota archaeon]|nr:hypothetical protein [Candidatus Micrarchaeota archaeon]